MAEENEGAEPEKKGKGKLIIIIVAVVVLLAGGAGAFFFMSSGGDEMEAETSAVPEVKVDEPATYVNIPQPFLFNVSGADRDRLVQIKVQIMVRGFRNEELARHHSPLIESTLLSSFGASNQDQLRSPTGRAELRDQATADIKNTLIQVVGEPVIEKVLFTDFVIQ
jgi:flagellar FliL protein